MTTSSSAWTRVFENPLKCSDDVTSLYKIIPSKVYEIGDCITVIFSTSQDERKQVTLDTFGFGKIFFSSNEFEEFLSTLDCFNTHWVDVFIIIGQYTLVFHHNGGKQSLKFEDASTDKFLLRWNEKLIHLFATHVTKLFELNTEYFKPKNV